MAQTKSIQHQPRIDVVDILREQTRQGAVLAGMREDMTEIKAALVGDHKDAGLLTKVHALESKAGKASKLNWYLFTVAVGFAVTLATTFIK